MERLHKFCIYIHVEDAKCCLCDEGMDGTAQHLFVECKWVTEARNTIARWAGLCYYTEGFQTKLTKDQRKTLKAVQEGAGGCNL